VTIANMVRGRLNAGSTRPAPRVARTAGEGGEPRSLGEQTDEDQRAVVELLIAATAREVSQIQGAAGDGLILRYRRG